MGKWFELDKQRLEIERQLLQERGFALDDKALNERGRVEFVGVIHDGQRDVDIRVICMEGFPYRIPLFIAPTLPLNPQSRHITFRTRMVCLRSAKPQEWRNTEHIVDLIPDATRILLGQHSGDFGEEHVAVDHDLFPVRNSKAHFIIPDDLLTPPEGPSFKVRVSRRFNRVNLVFMAGQRQTRAKFEFDLSPDELTVFRLKQMPLDTIAEYDDLLSSPHPNFRTMFEKYALNPGGALSQLENFKRARRSGFFGVVFPYAGSWSWQFFKVDSIDKNQISIVPVGTSALNGLVARISGVLDVNRLSQNTVLVAGCGGIGSTVAVELASAGIGRLFLHDFDFVSVANVIRHECSLAALGDSKSSALKVKIAAKNPLTIVSADGDIFADANFEQKVIESDLVVCAIGDYNTEDYINRVCVRNQKPMIFAYMGVYGAMSHVVRLSVKHHETGCWSCFQKQLRLGGIPNLPEIPDVNALTVELGCNNPSLPAPSFDQRTVALMAARKAVQWLDPGSYADDIADAIVFYARHLEGVVEEQSLKTKKYSVPAWEDCPICGDAGHQ